MPEGVNGKEDWIVQESVFIGIDVSKATLDIVMRPGGSRESIPNQEAQIGELVRRLSTLRVTLLVVEATGGVERRIVRALAAAELPVIVVNPRQVRDFAKATGRLAKTDKIDAEILAHFGEAVRRPCALWRRQPAKSCARSLPGDAKLRRCSRPKRIGLVIALKRYVNELRRISDGWRSSLIESMASLIGALSRVRSGGSRKTCSRVCLESDPLSAARCWLSCRSWESSTESRSLHW